MRYLPYATISIVAVSLAYCCHVAANAYVTAARDEHAIQAGLIQDTLPGQPGVYWVMPDHTEEYSETLSAE